MKLFAESLLSLIWVIRLGLLVALLLLSLASFGQSSATVSKTYDISNLTQLSVSMDNVKIKIIKGSRVIVERNINVKHSTLSNQILDLVKKCDSFCEHILRNEISDTLIISNNISNKHFIANNENADISISYTLYVPEHIKILQ